MDAFFSDTATTQAHCNQFAEQHFGGPVPPVRLPGSFSYTVKAGTNSEGEVVVQFRDKNSPLPDLDSPEVQQFGLAHRGLFPLHKRLGTVGKVDVHSMPKLVGDPYSTVFNSFIEAPHKRMKLTGDLASFFASIWNNASSHTIDLQAALALLSNANSDLPKSPAHYLPTYSHLWAMLRDA